MNEVKQYAERDAMALDEAGGYYMRHVMAMTGEQLHGKGDIAAELGWRDMQIAALQQKLDAVLAENARMLSDYREIPEMRRIGAPLTPATDAILNEARAEGIEVLTSRMQQLIDEGVFDAKEIGVAAGVVYEGAQISSQLRTGSTEGGV